MSRRRTHSPDFKARVAMWAISDRKTIQEIAVDHAVQSADEAAQYYGRFYPTELRAKLCSYLNQELSAWLVCSLAR
ncbi:hypothetical protein [Synechococcus sp. CBW1107]|uniref:hypothetical protein n=1 Tax=Synechococcus sp. CBW1107 TaxID=2789857 RepID=UPI002AD4C95F|nr:hypothetical protein [Synechococcus sp. CBW1107]CAK6696172.1 hypothetical protein ICNINCKA_01972 [Synechococcus sp. CBW1107]